MSSHGIKLVKPKITASLPRAWNMEPFTAYKTYSTKLSVLEEIGEVIAINPVSRHLLQTRWEPPILTLQFLGPYPVNGFVQDEAIPLRVTSKRFTLNFVSSITDVHWSHQRNLIYVLDSTHSQLCILDPTSDDKVDSPLAMIGIKLPPKAELSDSSRLAFVPCSPGAPEEHDAFAYLSVPSRSVVLRLSTTSGETEIVCGRVDRKGQPSSGSFAWDALLKAPGPLAYDERTHCLFIADNENNEIYGVRADQRIFVLSRLPSPASALLTYRAHDFIDANVLHEKEGSVKDRSWGERPSILIIVDREHGGVHKIPLYLGPKTSSRTTERPREKRRNESNDRGIMMCTRLIEHLFPNAKNVFTLLNGDLLIGTTQRRCYCMHIDLVQQTPIIDALLS